MNAHRYAQKVYYGSNHVNVYIYDKLREGQIYTAFDVHPISYTPSVTRGHI